MRRGSMVRKDRRENERVMGSAKVESDEKVEEKMTRRWESTELMRWMSVATHPSS